MSDVHAINCAGGGGNRLWSMLREYMSRQLLSMTGGSILLQATVNRPAAKGGSLTRYAGLNQGVGLKVTVPLTRSNSQL